MILAITNMQTDPMTCVAIPPEMLNGNAPHLVIASTAWEVAYVDVDECISEGRLRFLPEKVRTLYARVPSNPSRHQMILLTELFPAYAGAIRKAFLKGDDINGVLPGVWRQGDTPGRDNMQLPSSS